MWFGLNNSFRLRMMQSRQPVAWDHRPERCESSISYRESCRNNGRFESEDPFGRDNGPSLRLGRDDGTSLWFGLNNSFRLRMMRSRQPVAWDRRPERCESSVSCRESCRNNGRFESEDPFGRDNGPSLRLGRDDGSSLWFGCDYGLCERLNVISNYCLRLLVLLWH
jgi:hypothetical protein